MTFRPIGGQIRNPHVWISLVNAFIRLETQSGLAVARACMRGGIWQTGKSGYVSHRCLLSRFFARKIHSHRRSRATMASPWATRIAAYSSRSPLSRTPAGKVFTPAVQGIKNAHLRAENTSVCGRKKSLDPLSWWHMMAIWYKQHIGTYATERSFTNTRTHRKQAVVSLTKARIIFTNRTKKRNPTKPKSAESTHLDEGMAQSRRETLKYTQGTLLRLVLCACKVLE
jgi:hypothetical protein